MRSVLRQLIMRPRDVAVFSDDVSKVVDDLMTRIVRLRTQGSDGTTVSNINDLFFKYAMEGWPHSFCLQIASQREIFPLANEFCRRHQMCPRVKKATIFGTFASFCTPPGIAAILYECRLGCLAEKIPQETEDYIDALHLMFSSFKMTMYAGAIPKWLRPVFPKPWEEFCNSWDGLFRFSEWLTTKQQRHFSWPEKCNFSNEKSQRSFLSRSTEQFSVVLKLNMQATGCLNPSTMVSAEKHRCLHSRLKTKEWNLDLHINLYCSTSGFLKYWVPHYVTCSLVCFLLFIPPSSVSNPRLCSR